MCQIPLEIVLDTVKNKTTPYWLTGQNICNLRDADPSKIGQSEDYCTLIYFMVKEAWECGILLYDPKHGAWALNPGFGDYADWYFRWPNINAVLIALNNNLLENSEFVDEDDDVEMPDSF